jgi:hypothetical protein
MTHFRPDHHSESHKCVHQHEKKHQHANQSPHIFRVGDSIGSLFAERAKGFARTERFSTSSAGEEDHRLTSACSYERIFTTVRS